MSSYTVRTFAWFLDIRPNGMFSLYEYPVPGKNGLPLCEEDEPSIRNQFLY